MFDLVSKICIVRFKEVKFHTEPNFLSALHRCLLYIVCFIDVILWGFDQETAWAKFFVHFIEVISWEFDQKTTGVKTFVRFNQVSALEHVCFRYVLLYDQKRLWINAILEVGWFLFRIARRTLALWVKSLYAIWMGDAKRVSKLAKSSMWFMWGRF